MASYAFSKSRSLRESRPERNPKVQVEALVEALMEPLARKQRRELLSILGDIV